MEILKRIKYIYFTYGLLILGKKILSLLIKFFYYNIWKLSPFKFCISLYGVFIKKNFSDNSFKYSLIGQYGKFFSKFLKKQSEASIFIDIGANLGIYSLIALKNPFFTKIFSFEPQIKIFNNLTENIQRNSGDHRCIPMNYGISHFSKKGFLKIDEYDSAKSHLKVNQTGELRAQSEFPENAIWEDIELIGNEKLSSLLELDLKQKIGVKIDTEGHEFFVLEGLINTDFWQNICWIFIEFSRKIDHNKSLDFLTKEGFTIVKKIGSGTHYDLLMKR